MVPDVMANVTPGGGLIVRTPGGGLVMLAVDGVGIGHVTPFPASADVVATVVDDDRIVMPSALPVCGGPVTLEGVEGYAARHGGDAVLPVCFGCAAYALDQPRWRWRVPAPWAVSASMPVPVTIDMTTGLMVNTVTGASTMLTVDDA